MDVLTIKHALLEFGVTQAQLGAYAGLSAARMSRGLASELNGEAPFTGFELQLLRDTVLAMRSLQKAIPVPIAWAQTTKIKSLVDQHRAALHEDRDPTVKRAWYVRLNSLAWLKSVRGGEPLSTYNYQVDGVAFEDTKLAEEAVRRLRAVGVQSRAELLTAERRRSSITTNLGQIGFQVEEAINVPGH